MSHRNAVLAVYKALRDDIGTLWPVENDALQDGEQICAVEDAVLALGDAFISGGAGQRYTPELEVGGILSGFHPLFCCFTMEDDTHDIMKPCPAGDVVEDYFFAVHDFGKSEPRVRAFITAADNTGCPDRLSRSQRIVEKGRERRAG